MLNPSYSSLIRILNEDAGADARIASRYSVVIATAKRARQIVGGAAHRELDIKTDKAVSIAVNEIQNGYIRIVPGIPESHVMPLSEHVLHNLPTVIDDNFVSDDSVDSDDFDEEEVEDAFDEDDDWAEEEEDIDDEEDD